MTDYLPVARQIQILFEEIRKPDGSAYALKDVSQSTDISLPTLSQLRNGRITNPQLYTMRQICRFFGIPLRYFDTKSEAECYMVIAESRSEDDSGSDDDDSPEIRQISHMAASLTPAGQRDLLLLIRWAQAAERQHQAAGNLPDMPRLHQDDEA